MDQKRSNLRHIDGTMARISALSCLLLLMLQCECPHRPTSANAQTAVVAPKPIRINVGGKMYTDFNGNVWQSDINSLYLASTTNSKTASHCPRSILSTTNDELYCSYRWFIAPTSQPYRYSIPVTNGFKYVVRLHFAELYFTKIGDRTFDIYIEDVLRTSAAFDILQNSKGNQPNTAYIFTTTTKTVIDGTITIELRKRIENPALNGIEIIPVTAPIAAPTIAAPTMLAPTLSEPIRINVGGNGYTDPVTGTIWRGDNNGAYLTTTKNSIVSVNCPKSIADTTNDMLYCSYRYFIGPTTQPHRYNIPVMNGMRYTVRLHFAELFYTKIGQRVFDVYIENELRLPRFDIIQNADTNLPNTAYVITALSSIVTDGWITIEFVRQIEYPLISGIEVIPYTGVTGPPLPAPTTKTPVKVVIPSQPQQQPVPPNYNGAPYAIRINAGAAVSFTDVNTGKVWLNDDVTQYTKGGSKTYSMKNQTQCYVSIQETLEDRIYCSQRYYTDASSGVAQYNVPVRSGIKSRYKIQLHFAEIYHILPNQRVFSVYVEGTLIVSNLDVFQRVGSNTSYVVTTSQDISDGYVTIDFTSSKGQPFLSAVEVEEILTLPTPTVAAPIPTPPIPTFTIPNVPVTPPKFQEILINCGGKYCIDEIRNLKAGSHM
jgi:hypothetical protein